MTTVKTPDGEKPKRKRIIKPVAETFEVPEVKQQESHKKKLQMQEVKG